MFMFNLSRTRLFLSISILAVSILPAAVALASGGGDGHGISPAVWKDFGWRVLNFIVLVAILVWAAKKANMKGSLADRQAQIEKNLREAAQAREAAEAKLMEYTDKLAKANQEVDELRASMMRDAETEKLRIVAEAKLAAEKIAVQAAQVAGQELLKARADLRAEAGRLAVELAAGKLSSAVQKGDHDRFVQEYLGKVG